MTVTIEWIPVTDSLPERDVDGPVVLAAHGRRVPAIVRYDPDGIWRGAFTDTVCEGVTHWARLPAVPGGGWREGVRPA